ncbi:MAG TPA: hypothetical protein VFK05_28925 [Polyangiaceae bacterium]|nr:hypothetical protein [Polyangiaceae bacterium]
MKIRAGFAGWPVAALMSMGVTSACGAKDHAPFVWSAPPSTSDAGTGGRGPGSDHTPGSKGGSFDSAGSADPGGKAPASAGTGGGTGAVLTMGPLDPNEIYIFGTLREGSAGYNALAHWSSPNQYTLGFDAGIDDRSVQIWKGQLVYRLTLAQGIRIFQPELTTTLQADDLDYPRDPARNDPILKTPPCLAEDDGPVTFLTSPDDRLIYQCPDMAWYEDGEKVIESMDASEGRLLALGYDGLVLADATFGEFAVMKLADGQRHILDAANAPHVHDAIAYRTAKDGFHVVVPSKTGNPTPELWLLTPDASASRIGTYPYPVDGITEYEYNGVLSGKDELFEPGYDAGNDMILVRDLSGTSKIVYTEATDPRVKMHASWIFSGR